MKGYKPISIELSDKNDEGSFLLELGSLSNEGGEKDDARKDED